MDDLILLDTFLTSRNGKGDGFGVIVTSRRVFRNVETAVKDQGNELSCATDATYMLHFCGWTVVDCGSESVTEDRGDFVHRFVPWVYMFVRSESTEAYQHMFKTIRRCARLFFDLDVDVAFASLDHHEAIASAFVLEWPRVRLLTCWPHLLRGAKKKVSLLSSPDVYTDMIKPHLQLLRGARTHAQFIKMALIITTHWIESGERDFTDWFRSVYLIERWCRWHVNGPGIGGVIRSQHGIESHHAAIKRTCVPSSRAATTGVLGYILPRILRYDSEVLCPASCTRFCEGPVPPEMLIKAGRLLSTKDNYRKVHKGTGTHRRSHAVYFNSKAQIVEEMNPTSSPVTQERARRFAASLDGNVADGISAAEVKFELLSLQCVVVRAPVPREKIALAPAWPSEESTVSERSCSPLFQLWLHVVRT